MSSETPRDSPRVTEEPRVWLGFEPWVISNPLLPTLSQQLRPQGASAVHHGPPGHPQQPQTTQLSWRQDKQSLSEATHYQDVWLEPAIGEEFRGRSGAKWVTLNKPIALAIPQFPLLCSGPSNKRPVPLGCHVSLMS